VGRSAARCSGDHHDIAALQEDVLLQAPAFLDFGILERKYLLLGALAATFEDVPGTDLEDSTVNTVLGELAYQLTPIDTLIGRVDYAHFDSDASVFDQGSVLGGLGHSFSETFDAELLLGATYTTFEDEATAENPQGDSGDDTTAARS
jgi:hypothetical protein